MPNYHSHPLKTYSHLAEWLSNHPSSKLPVIQWLNTIKALKNIPEDEIDCLGIHDFLKSFPPKSKVTRSELCEAVDSHLANSAKLDLVTSKLTRYKPDLKIDRFSHDLLPKKVTKLLAETFILDCFKFSSFNYRIIKYRYDAGWFGSIDCCIVLDNKWDQLRPKRTYTMLEAVDLVYFAISHKFKKYISSGDETVYEQFASLNVGNQYQEWLLRLPKSRDTFTHGHFNINNVLMHIRTTAWTDHLDRQLLLIDELQSDWHARGREYGYYQSDESALEGQVPHAPFAKEWVELGVRVAITIALQKGLRYLAFVDSKPHIDRYDSSFIGLVELYDKRIPQYLNKLAIQFNCKWCKGEINVRRPNHRIKYSTPINYMLCPRLVNGEKQSVMNKDVALFYIKKTGYKEMRELKVLEISDALMESINQYGIPLFGRLKNPINKLNI